MQTCHEANEAEASGPLPYSIFFQGFYLSLNFIIFFLKKFPQIVRAWALKKPGCAPEPKPH